MIYEATIQRLIRLTTKAIDTIEKEIENGNWKLAVEILKLVGVDQYNRILAEQPTNELEIKAELKMKEKKAELSLL